MTTDVCETKEMDGSPPVISEAAAEMNIECACCSDQGVRGENQDTVMAGSWIGPHGRPVTVLVVADGMGGHKGGQVAAKGAVHGFMDALIAWILAGGDGVVPIDWTALILDLYRQANVAVMSYAEAYPELGTTLVTVLVYDGVSYVASIGDSRAYLVRNGGLCRMTRDDSFVQNLLDSGAITPEEADNHPLSNVITRSLGPGEELEAIAVVSEVLLPGDVLVLASDGFWKPADSWIVEKCHEFSDEPLLCLASELVETAKGLGSDDNISVALLQVEARKVDVNVRKTRTYWTNKETTDGETKGM